MLTHPRVVQHPPGDALAELVRQTRPFRQCEPLSPLQEDLPRVGEMPLSGRDPRTQIPPCCTASATNLIPLSPQPSQTLLSSTDAIRENGIGANLLHDRVGKQLLLPPDGRTQVDQIPLRRRDRVT